MRNTQDRLYDLLPEIYRWRDAEHGEVLRALLRVIGEQVDVVEQDIAQLYDNWFIETAEDWVVPYLADLLGYQAVSEAGRTGDVRTEQGRALNRRLIPRSDVTQAIYQRRRKGTLALLEELAFNVAGWPARAVEFYALLAAVPALNHLRLEQPNGWYHDQPARGRSADMRDGDILDRVNSPFDDLAHTVDVRHINSRYTRGRYNIPSVGLFVWRLKPYSVTLAPAYCTEKRGYIDWTFSVLGNDAPLYINPVREADPINIAGELNVPAPIRRHALENNTEAYYGEGKSLQIWTGDPKNPAVPVPVPVDKIVAADLSRWHYKPKGDQVAVDPRLGRITFSRTPKKVWVSYHYAFSDDMGGGEYPRELIEPHLSNAADLYLRRVGANQHMKTLDEAVRAWQDTDSPHAIIEITDSGVYAPQIILNLKANQTLQIRAASGTRPVLRLGDLTPGPDGLFFGLAPGSRLIFDGLLITGRGMQIQATKDESGEYDEIDEDNPAVLTVRHSTLVPGWALESNCEPKQPGGASIVVDNLPLRIIVDHSIIGPIHVNRDRVKTDPQPICINDSIVDAMSDSFPAIDSTIETGAHAALTIVRSTVIGRVNIDTLNLAENTIFTGLVTVKRRQIGCVRYSYYEHGSCIPRRYMSQPDGVEQAVRLNNPNATPAELEALYVPERARVRPRFTSKRYGQPGYCQLAENCAVEITRGADDESEMGAFHDLFQPQRAANLSARLDEFMPAEMTAGIIYAS